MIGKCSFDQNPRAPKRAYSSELFVALTRLVNLKYKIDGSDYKTLTKKEIETLIEKAKDKKTITYKDLTKLINENITIKDLTLSKDNYKKVLDDLKKKLKIDKEAKIDIKDLSNEERETYNKIYNNKLLSKTLIELEGYHKLKDCIIKCYNKEIWENIKNNAKLLDELATYCTNYKVNEDILNKIKESELFDSLFEDLNFINSLPNFKEHLMLSLNIIRNLIPLMIEGNTYDKAMNLLNYDHSNTNKNIEKKDLLVPIYVNENITNQRVIRSLTQARKVINMIIKKYGNPKIINIETARELARTKKERKKIEKSNTENKAKNDKIKQQLVENGLFESTDKISSNDLLKYKLWQEQNEFCGYSMKKISLEDLYKNNTVQIDHILPYSRTYNDNYLNKTLVYTKENQEKRNRTPYEWFGKIDKWNEYESYINNLNISQIKKDNYLLKNLDSDTERAMREQNLNDTKYISRELASLIKAHLNVEKVNMYPGAITGKLRARWGFNRLIHSHASPTYQMPKDMKEDIEKNRDNHLHHAIDALVIASITPSLQQKITLYEKFSRYIDGLTEKQLKSLNAGNTSDIPGEFYNDETGEVDDIKLKDYLKSQEKNIYFNKRNISKLEFPLPYKNFDKEAKARVYEQDLNVLKWEMEQLHTYTKEELENLHTLVPSIAKSKISGAMHEETYYGIKEIEKDEEIKKFKTLRTPIEKVKRSDLENILDKETGSKDIYNTLVEWFGDYKLGADVLKANGNKYPVNKNDKEQKEIKKLKIYIPYNNTGHNINKSNVEKGKIYKIDIFKSKDKTDDKLYFASYDMLEIKKINAINQGKTTYNDFDIKIDYGQGKNTKTIPYIELITNYEEYITLTKNDLVKITTHDNKESIAYIVGCTSGMLEVKSKLGDGYDIIKNNINDNNIFSKHRTQYYITVSTIKEIKKLSINVLGEINGL